MEKELKDLVSYQFGLYVGEYIIARYLPTLSSDQLLTNTIINITEEEADKVKELNDKWYSLYPLDKNSTESNRAFKNYLDYQNELAVKYLPNPLVVTLDRISEDGLNKTDFRTGINTALWDCDTSWYMVKETDFLVQTKWFTEIILELQLMDSSRYDVDNKDTNSGD